MFGKLQEAKKKADEIKERLETISLMSESDDGLVKVIVSGNRKIRDIQIARIPEQKEVLESAVLEAVQKALAQADNVAESEMKAVAGDLLPGGLGKLFCN